MINVAQLQTPDVKHAAFRCPLSDTSAWPGTEPLCYPKRRI
jgi:hypothetical protein